MKRYRCRRLRWDNLVPECPRDAAYVPRLTVHVPG
jgi:hypothetical protein